MSRLTGLGIVVRSLPQRPDTPTNPGIRGGISAGEREAGNGQRGLISRTLTVNFAHFILINVVANKSSKIDVFLLRTYILSETFYNFIYKRYKDLKIKRIIFDVCKDTKFFTFFISQS